MVAIFSMALVVVSWFPAVHMARAVLALAGR